MTETRKLIGSWSTEDGANIQRAFGPSDLDAAPMQIMMLHIIKRTQFNSFSGGFVYEELMRHRQLWDAVHFYAPEPGLILRDLSDDYYNADTLALLTTQLRYPELVEVVKHWAADSIVVMEPKGNWEGSRYNEPPYKLEPSRHGDGIGHYLMASSSDEDRVVIRLWWG